MLQDGWFKGVVATLCIATGMFVVTGCGDDDDADDDACKTGAQGTFECGVGQVGSQTQECVEGEWYFTTQCTDADGAVVDLGPDDVPPIDEAPKGDGNGNGDGNGDGNGADGDRPSDPATCQNLATADLDGAKTLPENTCYHVESTLQVKNGTLTIEPGVTFFMGYGSKITVGAAGRIQATGDADNTIWFIGTNDERGHWNGFKFRETGNGENLLDHVLIRHAGHARDRSGYASSRAAVYTDYYSGSTVHLTVRNSRIADSLGYGASLRSKGDVLVENTVIENNEKALAMHIDNVGGLKDDLTFTNNETSEILVYGREITTDATWAGFDLPYHIDHFGPHIKAKLIIKPGATLQFKENAFLQVQAGGALTADASGGDEIVFTGIETTTPGFWRGIWVQSLSNENIFKNVTISYAGRDSANLELDRSALAELQDVTLTHSANHGVSTASSAVLTNCQGLTFTDIAGDDFNGEVSGVDDCE